MSKADVDDESLHIAARHLNFLALKVLLEHDASVNLPGTLNCEGRTPLEELCRMANPRVNSAQLKKCLKMLCNATSQSKLKSRNNGKSLVLLALNNDDPLQMTRALLVCCDTIECGLNEDCNLFKQQTFFYSPTMYIRHFKCIERSGPHSLHPSQPCCTADNCPAPELERLLRAHGCDDRFWDDNASVNQPDGACGLPPAIVAAQSEAESSQREQAKQARIEAEEKSRPDALQAELDAAADAELRRENARLAAFERTRVAKARVKEAEYNARRNREQKKLDDQEKRENYLAREEEMRLKRLGDIKISRDEWK